MPRLPEHLDPWLSADRNRSYSGTVALGTLARLASLLMESTGVAAFELEFYRDRDRRPCVRGRVKAELSVQCQRCLGALAVAVDTDLALCVVRGVDEARLLPDRYDPLLVEADRIHPLDIVEDELLLALPQVPMHPPESCSNLAGQGERSEVGRTPVAETVESPFAALSALKKNLH